jgi:hypothetical protein
VKEALGLVLPWLALVAFWRPVDGVTHWRYYLGPAVASLIGLAAVLNAEAGNTPPFWVGMSASLAGIALAALVLVIEGILPLEWWVKDDVSLPEAPPVDQAA